MLVVVMLGFLRLCVRMKVIFVLVLGVIMLFIGMGWFLL